MRPTPPTFDPDLNPELPGSRGHLLITAGPTHEPIDAVRFLGNRSSGRMGLALAAAALDRCWTVTLLAGPIPLTLELQNLQSSHSSNLSVERFRTCADLETLLGQRVPSADVLIMAAAVADFRPKIDPAFFGGKFRRHDQTLRLELEPTPDLLAKVAATRRAEQFIVGFALEPRQELECSARNKLSRKRIDMVVGNPLETMDSDFVEAMVLSADGTVNHTDGPVRKHEFAPWLIRLVENGAIAHRTRLSQRQP